MVLILIVLTAASLRFIHLTSVPPSLYWDEVSQGYNAYSILKTGKDEHQEFLPLARFQAFGDYKAPVNIYLTVPSIALFGKTEFAVRFPSVLLGTLTVLVTFFLVRFLFDKQKNREYLALVAAFLLAISPWHIQLSRAAFEGNVATFFTVLGVAFFFYALRRSSWLILASTVSLILAFYSFNAHRVFIPSFGLLLIVLYWRELLQLKKQIVVSLLVGLILILPFFIYFQTPESKLRFTEVNIFSDVGIVKDANSLIAADGDSVVAKIVHNRRVLYARSFVSHYFDFFNPEYLFIKGDVNPRFSDRFNGQLYLWMLPLLLVGIYILYAKPSKIGIVLVGWILLAPLVGATARETPHALRSETFIPVFEIIAGLGAVTLATHLKPRIHRLYPAALMLGGGSVFLSVFAFWHNYLVHNPVLYSTDWQYGYRQVVEKTQSLALKYDTIYFTSVYGRPYIYVAWYGDFTPQEFWTQIDQKRDAMGFYNVDRLGKYRFVDDLPAVLLPHTLVVMPQEKIPRGTKVLDTITFLDGKPAFVIAETQ